MSKLPSAPLPGNGHAAGLAATPKPWKRLSSLADALRDLNLIVARLADEREQYSDEEFQVLQWFDNSTC